ncbi:acyl-ACP--UDP-N-acetylglucosamine O-acyltransferase [Flammeovirga pacifica]|uniref:Acyl-[acyl-carrier-protein]--UDP-N-acetylglucosamine O-acyltransferase n=1 Tax=Flammeovirga pacifica TaxID=915059 RepID=A0A1S1Z5L9_FLAPC|nr:acyl-ACP--UDP-N-acetylglucosamine O-acyltransferase [Flammeovirga pacifica]OHX68598.1 acyl-[acyl-carrier-protein]--UDP-N-acetylglucosamine O-acyltransferase [Flammeovirga pacifica]
MSKNPYAEKYPMTNIHPDAKIAEGVTVDPFATIQGDVEIGEGTWIGPNAVIMDGARIGKNVKVFPGACISGIPQDLKFKGEQTLTYIGDNTTLRECVTVSRGTTDKMKTVVGSNCMLMAYVHIAHDVIMGDNCILSNSTQIAGHVEIADHVIIAGTAAVHQFVKIGSHAFIAGGSLVRKDVPPFVKAAREPLSYCGINSVGLRRRGYESESLQEIHEMYRLIYTRGFTIAEATRTMEEEFVPSEERDAILGFLKDSERGIIKGY